MSKRTNDRITIEALKYYVPLFQVGDEAEEIILKRGAELTPHELHHYETLMKLKNISVTAIAELSGPLITREINKLIAGSHLRNSQQEDLFTVLYYAGLDGMKRGLRKFEVDKINSSSTNYLFQWIVTYAKKELVMLEAPFGIPPSRFQRYKKISAVRKKITETTGHYATNEEVYDFFQSGEADLKTMNGRVTDHHKPSQANRNIDINIIEEQERFEKEFLTVDLLDPLEDYSTDVQLSGVDNTPFAETVFGIFVTKYNVTDEAIAVIMSDLSVSDMSEKYTHIVNAIEPKRYKNLSTQWKNLIKDKKGPFYDFLKANVSSDFDQFDVRNTLKSIEANQRNIHENSYRELFKDGEIEKL